VTVEALSPAHAIGHVARWERAGLIVVGAHPRRPLDRLAGVDHAMQLLHSAPAGVAVVPDGTVVRRRPIRIAVGFDGSAESRAAVRVAADLAGALRARLWIQVVVDTRRPHRAPRDAAAWSEAVEQEKLAAHALLDEALAGLADDDVDVEGGVSVGDPVGELAATAPWADLLVLGSRRWGPIARLALGSTAEAVMRRRLGPVLVLPRTAHQPRPRVAAPDTPAVNA
jgi:nucleotide-binding universal stress UspA family protein